MSVVDAGSVPARWAMERYFDELDQRFPEGFDPGDALASAPGQFNDPGGAFVIVQQDGEPVACGALQYLDGDTAEIKRMWVDGACRGAGLGRRLVGQLEALARQAGRSRVLLDTNDSLSVAIAMYRSCGYSATGRYNDNPYADHWFTKTLTEWSPADGV
jgi:GNAT superfamily N-acetyltransferase